MQQSVSASASSDALPSAEPWWPQGWWKIMDQRIGIIPIPIYIILCALLAGLTYTGDIKGEVSVMIAILVIGGFTCAEIGKRLPVLRNIGAAAIFATFIPSALAYYNCCPRRSRSPLSNSQNTRTFSTCSSHASSSEAFWEWTERSC